MSRPARTLLILVAVVLAGCASGPAHSKSSNEVGAGDCPVIRGIVVDEAIRPLAGATIEVVGQNASVPAQTTDKSGAYTLPCLPVGSYLIRASHPLYSTVQQAVEVGDSASPPLVKIQLQRVIFANPYVQVQKFDGFVVCSIGFFEYASEECGEGVGVPCEVPQPVGCHRWGGQSNNHAQWDFRLDGDFVRTLVVEMMWTPTSSTMKEFQLNVGNDWTCDPTCNGNPLNVTGGPSPLRATVDFPHDLTNRDGSAVTLGSDTRFSTMIWPNWGCANFGVSTDPNCLQQLNVAINQAYTMFATAFYYLPAPDGWSFVNGDPMPF